MAEMRQGHAVNYQAFLERKAQVGHMEGFKPLFLPDFLFDFQQALVEWTLSKGKAAIFADCGLGKTPMQLVWADYVRRHVEQPVLILTPLAVSAQTVQEGAKFGIECRRSLDGSVWSGINVANYERLHYFNAQDFGGVVCDESSILKNFDGKRKSAVTEFMRRVPYRLLCTATAAPNDYIELGTSSEALGELGYTDMLTRFFVNSQHTIKPRTWRHSGLNFAKRDTEAAWRFKGHAEQDFWRWVGSWARAMRRPSDLGFSDAQFALPPLIEQETVIKARLPRPGMLFDVEAIGLREERELSRRTLQERCEAAASKVAGTGQPAVIWCHLNDEGDLLAKLIPDGQQVSGSDSDEVKEAKFEAFRAGQTRVLIIKPKIGAFGLNWQHCAHVVYFPSHSYEQYYQAVRRCWRFGQTRPVVVDLIRTEAEARVLSNLKRKSEAADRMFTDLVVHMGNALHLKRNGYHAEMEVPSWL